tara:strand:- start:10252 stop:10581 length:330 start_codon:yes stop_codon:yes gene_type:complete
MKHLPEITNLLASPGAGPETIAELVQVGGVRLEQIISNGNGSEPDFWYDQEQDEWVMLVRGEAVLEFEGGEMVELAAGDALTIPAHGKHRVRSTSRDAIWLALHYPPQT